MIPKLRKLGQGNHKQSGSHRGRDLDSLTADKPPQSCAFH